MRVRRLLILIWLLMSPLLALPGLGAGESVRETVVFLNSREDFSGEALFSFTPGDSGEYALCALPLTAEASCRVSCDGEPVGEGTLPLRLSLAAENTYRIRVSGGSDTFEIMRLAHGRAMESPITLGENTLRYTKSVTAPRDVHWFSYTAPEGGLYTFRTETAEAYALDTIGYLLDEQGNLLAYNDDIISGADPNFRIFHRMEAGETALIRVSAFSNDTGLYRLVVSPPQGSGAAPQDVSLAFSEMEMDVGDAARLDARLSPDDAYPDLAYSTYDADVARVSPDGTVTAVGAGETRIAVTGYGGVAAYCHVKVRPIELTGLEIAQEEIRLPAGAAAQLTLIFTPANATDQRVSCFSSDRSVAQVDENGQITALSEGACRVVVMSNGGLTASVSVTVTAPRAAYRALVMSEHKYDDGRTRVGAINTAQGMADMLEYNGYSVTLLLDSSYEELARGLSSAFAGAQEGDVSLFYINCHGKTENGVGYFELHDGARVTAVQLERLLSQVPGRVVVLLDFCQSGSFLRSADWTSPLMNGRYLVFASANYSQDSYRMGDGGDTSEAGMATVFARSLSEGGGWDLMRDRSTYRRADANRDGEVTFEELRAYVIGRVGWYLSGTGAAQTPQASREGSGMVLLPLLE